jgi:hypothetical protein
MQYMNTVAAAAEAPPDLIDLRFLPSWVKQDAPRYADFEGEDASLQMHGPSGRVRREDRRRDKRHERGRRDSHERPRASRGERPREPGRREQAGHRRDPKEGRAPARPQTAVPEAPPPVEIHFVPQSHAFENVAAQIKSGTVAYSLYALARLFLQKPERYDVRVTAKNEEPFFRLGESNFIGTNRAALESSAFRTLRNDYYEAEVTLTDPIKGNFTSVARERSSGILLGPTNHHAYQPQLRRLYEQRFSRRLSFLDFQRQIEIVNDPALVEQWKEDARKQTRFITRKENPPQTFASEPEAERNFREKYLPGLVSETRAAEIDGCTSRQLRDHGVGRAIENAWSAEERSPSNMMQELAGRFRGAGLHIFRHRKGMLFVSPIRPKAIDETGVSDSVGKILETLKASPRINRKDLAEKLIGPTADADEAKMKLASDLHWLVREGHIVEFNDGALDLPRIKAPNSKLQAPEKSQTPSSKESSLPASEFSASASAGEDARPPDETVLPLGAS